MLLEPNKIYPTYRKCQFLMMPSLEVSEGVKVFVSDKGTKPTLEEMTEDDGIKANKINSFITVPRWIAFTAETDDYDICECGLVTNPFVFTEQYISPDESVIVDKKETILYIDNNKTFLEW